MKSRPYFFAGLKLSRYIEIPDHFTDKVALIFEPLHHLLGMPIKYLDLLLLHQGDKLRISNCLGECLVQPFTMD